MPDNLSHQFNVRVSQEIYGRVEKLAKREERPIGEVVRMILQWALPEAELADSLANFARRKREESPKEGAPRR